MSEITLRFGRTLIAEKATAEHCFECGDVMLETQYRAWMTAGGEPIKKLTVTRKNGDVLPIVYCKDCEPEIRERWAAE
ncbi:MAG: hypothetical protein ACKOWO_04705, partial [Sediminibacterium sp.]